MFLLQKAGKSASTLCQIRKRCWGRMRFVQYTVYLLFLPKFLNTLWPCCPPPPPPMKICLKPQRGIEGGDDWMNSTVIISSIKTKSEDADAEIAPRNSQHLN
jgi:hypothetical protein